MITTGIETITPQIAEALLKQNIGNRSINVDHVARLAKAIDSDNFELNGDTIRIDENGGLIDGQHRLSACVKANKPFQTLVVRGLPRKTFLTIDQGKIRSHGDTLSVLNVKNGKDIGAALKIVERYFTSRLPVGKVNFTNQEIVALLEKYPDIVDATSGVLHTKGLLSRSTAIACKYLFRKKDEQLADRFFESIISGQDLQEGSPVYILRERLMRNAMGKAKLGQEYIVALTIKAWNSLRSGKEIKTLRFRENGDFQESFPVVQ